MEMGICAVRAEQSGGTITHPPYVTLKMAAISIALPRSSALARILKLPAIFERVPSKIA